MDLRSLRYFLQIAGSGSLTRAAARLRVAQPSLTRHMHQLEEELGTPLFVRASKGVSLTDAGVLLREHAERILRDVEHVRGEIRARETVPRGTVALGMPPTLCPVLLPPLIARMRAAYPSIELDLRQAGSMILPDWLAEGRIDAAVTTHLGRDRALTTLPLVREEMVLLQPPGSGGTGPVAAEELRHLALTMTQANLAITDALLAPHGLELCVDMVLNSLETIRLMVQSGLCRTVLPYAVVQRDAEKGLITARRLLPGGLHRQLVLAFLISRRIPPAVQAVCDLLRETVAEVEARDGFALPRPSRKRIAAIR